MRLGYYDKYGRVQVAEVICSTIMGKDCSGFQIVGGISTVNVGFNPWGDNVENNWDSSSIERYVIFEGMSGEKHDKIVYELIAYGWHMVDKEFVGEIILG